jgi:hypothetical protein
MAIRRSVIMDLHPIYTQIQHPLHRTITAAYHELIYYSFHLVQAPHKPVTLGILFLVLLIF